MKPSLTQEKCQNPWKPDCKNTDVEVYIQIKGKKLPICSTCWDEIAESDLEWGDEIDE